MSAKKCFTKVTLGLSLSAFCFPVFLSLYIIQYCPAILRASDSSKGWYFVGGIGNGILFFSAVWVAYGIIRWVLILPLYWIARCFCKSVQTQKLDELKDKQKDNQKRKIMKIRVNCPQCGRSLKGATQEMIGDIGVCPKCRTEFTIEQEREKPKEKAVTIETQSETNKGRASTLIAVLLIVLQILLMLGGLYGGRSQHQVKDVSFHDAPAIIQSITFLFGFNIIGIGALALSLIVWLYHKDKAGKVTTIIAFLVIVANSFIAIWY